MDSVSMSASEGVAGCPIHQIIHKEGDIFLHSLSVPEVLGSILHMQMQRSSHQAATLP